MRFVADEPIRRPDDDLLRFKDFVDLIEGAVRSTEAPFVYGVLGDWGTGKTSALRLLEARFRDENGRLGPRFPDGGNIIVPIWFDAWKYENEAHIVYPLLYAIKKQYEFDVGQEKRSRIASAFRTVVATSLLVVGQVGLKALLSNLTSGAVDLKLLEESITRVRKAQEGQEQSPFESILSDWTDSVGQFSEAFEALLDTYARELVGSEDQQRVRFLILVDDLDRCLPETTISILESIKHHLSVPRCIFVLAINGRVIYQTIRRKYGSEMIDGREYLEKIINYSFYMPELDLSREREAMREFVEKQRQVILGRDDLRREFNALINALSECKFNNPRRIKRILNRFVIYLKRLPERDRGDAFLPNAIRLMLIAEYFPTLFQLYMRINREASERIKKLLDGSIKVQDFEVMHGINVAHLLPQMRHMQELFNLPAANDQIFANQVQQIFELTRLF
ncbi:MAG: hypothetical protein CUN49_09285 [Candidatus Thermofonsia Clade 1 bacterium]|uniref:KAP NTPase domain-containing protein n=1 Tax=Candidatus Thermofonsia Clade 1 bacterium TaxID=2364210 RepID=A0A2M8PDR4_9CHLR|nr:MAG: hypothetical protein CUN49_09285 [Candidatus Thermofonsia Clade 1 bacterium]PJF42117.1 MAG: hypothetical protein CUN50_05290 [Candidatus Thermofonsia Clade 1 bacterium]RMF48760.1 MAG: hypothetical protein D6749_14820 [Chloroflexota bacterium]